MFRDKIVEIVNVNGQYFLRVITKATLNSRESQVDYPIQYDSLVGGGL